MRSHTIHPGWCSLLMLGVLLALPVGASAQRLFPAAEVQEAHGLRQRVLAETAELDSEAARARRRLSPETLASLQQRLTGMQEREASNPFFAWAQGEVLRQSQGVELAARWFERARQLAGSRFLVHWLLWQDYLQRDLPDEAAREEKALRNLQLTWGLSRFPLLSAELMRRGSEAAARGDFSRAQEFYDGAVANTPEAPDALMGRAAVRWQADKGAVLAVGRDLVQGVLHTVRGGRWAGQLASNLLLSLQVAWLVAIGVLAVIFLLKSHVLFAHDLGERVLARVPAPVQGTLALLVVLLPLVLGLGLLWSALVALVLIGPHLTRREQGMVSIFIAGLVLLPMGYRWVAATHVLAASPELGTARAVEEGARGEGMVRELQAWVQAAPQAGLPEYYLSLVQKRRGELVDAEGAADQALQRLPGAGFPLVAQGNLLYLQGRPAEAETAYRRAAEMLPASPAVQLNLVALYTQRLLLDQSKDALSRAQRLDPFTVGMVSDLHGAGATAVVLDEPVPWVSLAANLSPSPATVQAVAEGLWGAPLRGVRLGQVPLVAILVLAAFWVHVAIRRRIPPVRRCIQCGTPFCSKCQVTVKEKEYCRSCASVFRSREGVAAFVRIRRQQEGEDWARRERVRSGLLGSLLPGGSDLYRGRTLIGLLLALPAIWLVLEGGLLDALTPSFRFATLLPGGMRLIIALGILLVLFGISIRRGWSKPRPLPR
jgi:tetratricopeptide (TPR) repeat protein